MKLDLSEILGLIDPNTFIMCLCIGFALKYARIFKAIGNRFIPLIMLILGCGINCLQNLHAITISILIGGMVAGLASTGCYELFRNIIYGKKDAQKTTTETK